MQAVVVTKSGHVFLVSTPYSNTMSKYVILNEKTMFPNAKSSYKIYMMNGLLMTGFAFGRGAEILLMCRDSANRMGSTFGSGARRL